TAAPVSTMTQTATREAMARRRTIVGETTGIRPVSVGSPGDGDPTLTPANRTGALRPGTSAARDPRLVATPPVAVGFGSMVSHAPALRVAGPRMSRIGSYVALTKPRIIELLLVTTLPTMVVAQRGLPRFGLIAATLLGGALAAGGANAVNM